MTTRHHPASRSIRRAFPGVLAFALVVIAALPGRDAPLGPAARLLRRAGHARRRVGSLRGSPSRPTRQTPANCFTDVAVDGELKSPSGAVTRVEGFCDSPDGRTFRVRFMPSEPGEHQWTVSYRQSEFKRIRSRLNRDRREHAAGAGASGRGTPLPLRLAGDGRALLLELDDDLCPRGVGRRDHPAEHQSAARARRESPARGAHRAAGEERAAMVRARLPDRTLHVPVQRVAGSAALQPRRSRGLTSRGLTSITSRSTSGCSATRGTATSPSRSSSTWTAACRAWTRSGHRQGWSRTSSATTATRLRGSRRSRT